MRVDTPALLDMSVGSARVIPEEYDSSPHLIPQIHPTLELLLKTSLAGAPVGVPVDQSLLLSVPVLVVASSVASAVTLATLVKGCYTIDMAIAVRSIGAWVLGAGGVPDVAITFTPQAGSPPTVRALGVFAVGNRDQVGRRIRVSFQETTLIRREIEATGVGQTIEVCFMLSIERHL